MMGQLNASQNCFFVINNRLENIQKIADVYHKLRLKLKQTNPDTIIQ